jgi:hypothetical protein
MAVLEHWLWLPSVVSLACFAVWAAFGICGPEVRSSSQKLVNEQIERHRALIRVQFDEHGAILGNDEGVLFLDRGGLHFLGVQSEFLIARPSCRQVPEFEGAQGSWCFDWDGEGRQVRIRIWPLSRVYLTLEEDPEHQSAGRRFEPFMQPWLQSQEQVEEIAPPSGIKPTLSFRERLTMLFVSLIPKRFAA